MFCAKCGKEIFVASDYCTRCGARVPAPERVYPFSREEDDDYTTRLAGARPSTPQHPQRGWLKHILLGLLGLFAIAGIATVIGFGLGVLTFPSTNQTAVTAPGQPKVAPTPAPSLEAITLDTNRPSSSTNANAYAPSVEGNRSATPNTNVYSPPVNGDMPVSYKPPPVDLVAGSMQVEALHYRYIFFTVQPSIYPAAVAVGRFEARGGSNDIEVLIIPAEEMSTFQNHGSLRAPLKTGYVGGRNFKTHLPPGDYYLIFNNQRSLLTNKLVTAYVQLRYE